jgi:cytoskeletal protein CcmA (bactofilin family)
MFGFRRRRTIIAEKLKIVGSVTAEGAVEVNGDLEGDLRCKSLTVSRKARIRGSVQADRIVVSGKVEGPIRGRTVALKSCASVTGDIVAKSLSIEQGAFFDGRSASVSATNDAAPPRLSKDSSDDRLAGRGLTASSRVAPAEAFAAERSADKPGPRVAASVGDVTSKKKTPQGN